MTSGQYGRSEGYAFMCICERMCACVCVLGVAFMKNIKLLQ